ncbi:MAG: VOC family protein [Candidatus Sphingomonas colombiensis]|nr:VOC family protein [Sphingomonas sp.]WEK42225.1 MAG: VOC family protein [Sphingomonas sp.]
MTTAPTTKTERGGPDYIAHFVVRTSDFEGTLDWHRKFFDASDVYYQDGLAFLTFDDEHHRIAIGHIPGLTELTESTAGVDHIAFTIRDFDRFIRNYERLKANGILPIWCINHGPTTSLYYCDPNGIKLEIQIDNAAAIGSPAAFFKSDTFSQNPIGVEFDPDLLVKKFHSGEPLEELMKQGSAPVETAGEN